jgi:hypothetical protein
MTFLILKAALSGIIIAVASEVARRNPAAGALIVSLPLVSILAMIWLWRTTGSTEKVAANALATFWYVLPTMPMFLVLPWTLRAGWGFWPSLGSACVLTIVLYLALVWVAPRWGIAL